MRKTAQNLRCPHCGKLIRFHCKRCGHTWSPRLPGRPARCANCGDPYWDIPRGKLRLGRPPKKKRRK